MSEHLTDPTAPESASQPAQPLPEVPTPEALMHILAEIRPMIQMDGGDIEFVEFKPEDGEVHIRMAGACVGCPASSMTLKMGIEQAIQERFPDLEVVAVA